MGGDAMGDLAVSQLNMFILSRLWTLVEISLDPDSVRLFAFEALEISCKGMFRIVFFAFQYK